MVNKKRRLGFTIVELVIVIVVIAVLAAVLIPTFVSITKKANLSADMVAVREMNTILASEEITDGKPTTVVDAQEVLLANGINDFSPMSANSEFYWVGSENRVILWDLEETKVTYPDEYAKKYKDLSAVSVEWYNLDDDYGVQIITSTEGGTLASALILAINSAPVQSTSYFVLPKDSVLTLTSTEIGQFNAGMTDESGIGKNVHIDLNGSTLNAERENTIFAVPDGGSLEIVDGKMDIISTDYNHAGFQVGNAASLTLRNVDITGVAKAMIFPANFASEVIIDKCNIVANVGWILMPNGMTSSNLRIVIKDSYLKNSDLNCDYVGMGVQINCTSSVYIENSTISSYAHALAVRAGHVEVINSTLESYGEDAGIYKYDSFTHFLKKPKKNEIYIEGASETYTWSEANALPAAVLVLGDYAREVESYPGDVVCDLVNVKFNSKKPSEIPNCLLAAKLDKNVTLNYDSNCNLGTPIMYNYMIPEYFGTITVNGESKNIE